MIDSPPCWAPPAYVRAGQSVVLPILSCDGSLIPTPRLVVRQAQYGYGEVAHGQVHYSADASPRPAYYVLDSVAFTTYEGDDYEQSVQVVPASSNYPPRCALGDPEHPGARTFEVESDETLTLLAHCDDGEGDPFTAGFDPVSFGDLHGTGDNRYVYTPPAGDPGPDGTTVHLAYGATDAPPAPARAATSDPAAVTVHVARADSNPVCTDQVVMVMEDSGGTAIPVSCTDADPGDTLTAGVLEQPADLTVTPSENTVVVTPRRGFSGTETVPIDASDGDDTAPPATLTVVVWPRDRAAAQRRKVKTYLRDVIAPGVLQAVQHGRRIGPFPQGVKVEARVAGASTTLAFGSLRLAPGRAATVPLRLSRSGRILRHAGRLHGQLTVTVGTDGVSGRASGSYR